MGGNLETHNKHTQVQDVVGYGFLLEDQSFGLITLLNSYSHFLQRTLNETATVHMSA